VLNRPTIRVASPAPARAGTARERSLLPRRHLLRGFSTRVLFLSFLLSFFVFPASAQQVSALQRAPLERRILAIVGEQKAQGAHWGVEVVSVRSGRRLAAVNPKKRFVPASTAKLFPAAAALARLGPDFIYRTTVETTALVSSDGRVQGDLVLVGRGDPNLSGRVLPYNGRTEREEPATRVFQELAAQVFQRGVRSVEGNLVADDSYFVAQPYGTGWEADDLQWGYGAPVSALAINDNVVVVRVLPGARAGEPASVRMEPLANYYQLENRVVTVPRAEPIPGGGAPAAERLLGIDRRPGSTLLRLWGQVPERGPEWTRALAIEDPPRFAGEVFRQELARLGIEIKGTVSVRRLEPFEVADLKGAPVTPTTPSPTTFAAHESVPLAASLKVILKVSQNLHAEMLLRTLGRERRNVGSADAGLEEVSQFMKEIGVSEDDVLLRDSSGLSRQNLVTPSATTALLRSMYNSPRRDLWMDSLPVAGTDGSLQNRLRGRAVAGRVRAKTGALAGVAALAGYAPNARGELLAFAIFVNHHDLPNGEVVALIDRIVQEIAASQ